MFKLVLEKAEEPEIKLRTSTGYTYAAAAAALQSCLTVCDPIDSSPLGSTVPGILQARILEWVAISFSNTALTYSFSYLEPVCRSMSSSNCCFLTCIQISHFIGWINNQVCSTGNYIQYPVINHNGQEYMYV